MGAFSSLATTGLNLALAQQAQAADAKRQAASRDRQIKSVLASDAESRRQSDLALQRQLAQARARAGAAGVGGVGGAIDAVTAGLTQQTRAAESLPISAGGPARPRDTRPVRKPTVGEPPRPRPAAARWKR